MSDKSAIEWTDATWNPIVGCSLVSPGCTNCYAMKMAERIENIDAKKRLQNYADHRHLDETHPNGRDPTRLKLLTPHTHYAGTTLPDKAVWSGKVALAPDQIVTKPLRWKKPRRIFVNSMGDLFHESVPDEWIDRVFAVMALRPQHTFQVLTKRPKRMREYICTTAGTYTLDLSAAINTSPVMITAAGVPGRKIVKWPLPNVWLGVTAEDQRRADERIPDLLATPAAVRFVSCEPLLGEIDLRSNRGGTLWIGGQRGCGGMHKHEGPNPHDHCGDRSSLFHGDPRGLHHHHDERCGPGLDWVIAGGESGPSARPSHPDWFRGLRDQCAAADVPFFFKQWGEWKDGSDFAADAMAVLRDGRVIEPTQEAMQAADRESAVPRQHPTMMRRVGKARAGRLLDGREHNEFSRAPA